MLSPGATVGALGREQPQDPRLIGGEVAQDVLVRGMAALLEVDVGGLLQQCRATGAQRLPLGRRRLVVAVTAAADHAVVDRVEPEERAELAAQLGARVVQQIGGALVGEGGVGQPVHPADVGAHRPAGRAPRRAGGELGDDGRDLDDVRGGAGGVVGRDFLLLIRLERVGRHVADARGGHAKGWRSRG
jgi:hypothetical protein